MVGLLNNWHQTYEAFINEKTTRAETPDTDVPKWVKPKQTWWYTHHRGMGPEHQRRAVEWWCYLNSPGRHDPWSLAKPAHWEPAPPAGPEPENDSRPALYDTHATVEEGLWDRKGWAGRSHP